MILPLHNGRRYPSASIGVTDVPVIFFSEESFVLLQTRLARTLLGNLNDRDGGRKKKMEEIISPIAFYLFFLPL